MSAHENAALLQRLFAALDRHDHSMMASCYHPDAEFRDIAFFLHTKKEIHSMWHMICEGDIRTSFELVHADDQEGRATLVDVYTFGASKVPPKPGRPVRNVVDSNFRFREGLIVQHHDFCDARKWAASALGGPIGFLAGNIRLLRSLTATAKLAAFVDKHPEYQ